MIVFDFELEMNFLNCFLLCMISINPIIILNTSFYEKGVQVTNRHEIGKKYFNYNFFIDFLQLLFIVLGTSHLA